jgi:diguanylate cyclase (GGDEF)-like protein
MKKIWDFFENMNEIVYVSDMDSYEMVYMNRRAREIYGVTSLAELQGMKCYEVLQRCSEPCAICTNRRLKEGEFTEWTYLSPVLKRTYLLKDTVIVEDGRRYRLEMALDITAQEQQRETIRNYIDNEAMINEALRLSMSAALPEQSIRILLEHLGKTLECDRIYIFEIQDGILLNNTYEWCARGVEPQIRNLQSIPREQGDFWLNKIRDGGNIIIEDVEKASETDPVARDFLIPQKIRSVVISPLLFNHRLLGFYGVDDPPAQHMQNISTLFQIMGHFIAALLRRRDLFSRLEHMSYCDHLTGAGNRHAVQEYIAGLKPEESIGVVYCDVMGLKKVNDRQGHRAGDALLLGACECLKNVFPEDAIFRIGGDEFLVLCRNTAELALTEKVQKLREVMAERSAMMAVGCIWQPRSDGDMDTLLALADESMYEDKRKYYDTVAENQE